MTDETFGTIDIACGFINLTSDPYVRVKVMRLFPGMKDDGKGTLSIKDTAANCEDLKMILDRWPHRARPGVMTYIRTRVAATVEARAVSKKIMQGEVPLAWELAFPLRDYQAVGVGLTMKNPGLLLADTVGLGKTATGIGTISAHRGPALVVCPNHLQRQWEKEVAKFAPRLRTHIIRGTREYDLPEHDVTIINYHKLDAWATRREWKTVVFDEVHELRGDCTNKGQAAAFLAESCAVRLGLSATPIFNYAGEIYNVYRGLAPGALGTWEEFKREWKSDDKGRLRDPIALGAWLRSQFLYLRRTREEVGRELPPEETIYHTVEHDPKVMERILASGRPLAAKILSGKPLERGQAFRELDAKLRQATGISKAPFVADFVAAIVEGGESVILAGWHHEVYGIWETEFAKRKIRFAKYTGEQTTTAKDIAAARFMAAKDDPSKVDVLILSLRAGEGLDGLQNVCRTIVFGELDWSPQRHVQLIGRARRDRTDGKLDERVTAFFLVSKVGSDPIVAQVLGNKWKSATAVVDPSKLNAEDSGEFTQEMESRAAMLARDFLSRHK